MMQSCMTTDRQNIQDDLNTLQQWSDKWKLSLNASKCKTLHIGKDNVNHSYVMSTPSGQVILESKTCEKDLGVWIDDNLSFDEHISQAVKRANAKLAMIRRTFTYMDKKMLVQLYTSLVRPILEYGNVIWSPHLQSHINQLEGVQHHATRMLSSISHLPYSDRLKELNLPSLSYRRMRGDAIEMYKYCHNNYNVDKKPFNLVNEMNNQSVTRNHGFKVKKEKTNTSIRSRFFGNRAANMWNALPASIVNAPSLDAFKWCLDEHWKAHRFVEDMRTIPFHRTISNASINFW